jgi:four helix bundle protein
MAGNFLKLNDISAYKDSFHLSNYVWKLVARWDILAKNTVGRQFIRAVDSISANIAEGFGRRFKRDKIKFYYYAYASVVECLDWNEKSKARGLILPEEYEKILTSLQDLRKELNGLIKFTANRVKK